MRSLNIFFTMWLIVLLFSNCDKSKQSASVHYSRTFSLDTAISVDHLFDIEEGSYVPGQ